MHIALTILPLAGEDQRRPYPRTTSISSNRFHR